MKCRIKEKILGKKVDDEIVIIDADEGPYSCLNRTGPRIGEKINKGRGIEEISRELSKRQDTNASRIEKGVDASAKQLLKSGFLEKAG